MYGKYSVFATGGAIGDVLFFFCSGFTLFLGKVGRFDNWYKRRINRIYPTVFTWAIITAFIFGRDMPMNKIVISGGGWLVTCIMLYYTVLYLIQRFLISKLKFIFVLCFADCIAYYNLADLPTGFNMYGYTYFKWFFYFIYMLTGAIIGLENKPTEGKILNDGVKLSGCIGVFYTLIIIGKHENGIPTLQV